MRVVLNCVGWQWLLRASSGNGFLVVSGDGFCGASMVMALWCIGRRRLSWALSGDGFVVCVDLHWMVMAYVGISWRRLCGAPAGDGFVGRWRATALWCVDG